MYEQHLQAAGLTRDQAKIYETLVREGSLQGSGIARRTGLPRTMAYAVLGQLRVLALVERHKESGSVATFSAAHPFKLQEFARGRLREAEQANASVVDVLAPIISEFNTASGQPGIRILGGIDGVRELYADVRRERQPISVIRSPHDARFLELREIVDQHVREQARLGISARIITRPGTGLIPDMLARDKKRRTVRRFIDGSYFKPPAQMIIYAKKIALTAYNEQIITTIIENADIHATCMILFESVWAAAEIGHRKIIASAMKSDE